MGADIPPSDLCYFSATHSSLDIVRAMYMKPSTHCVYCGVLMNKVENHPHCRSVEHMIPQVSVSIHRTNGEGDFYVCKKCNGDKSRIDEVLGVICRMVGEHSTGSFDAVNKFHNALKRKDSKFREAFQSVRHTKKGAQITLPLNGREIYQYGTWLAKGVFFLEYGQLLTVDKLIWINIVRHDEVMAIKEMYRNERGSEAFDDLSKNSNIPNINGESFLIVGQDAREMFICFNRVMMFHIKILDRTFINQKKCKKALLNLEKRVR
ncbi:hypothetical protein HRZ20_003845 [Escherichia coli]|nr:hypothetical protein [Escherichia coli]EIO5903070.1 hypothetical protein [Salmonella enterica]KDW48001.1 hypothetical protein AB62_4856 [Escherichia coli 2-210-07_S1_C3]KDW87498.1 hypothetical protein AB30_4698 [Escherichia coli 2-210-07_S1_C2]EFO0123433.1 hypothetical protein [Escherichia coli]